MALARPGDPTGGEDAPGTGGANVASGGRLALSFAHTILRFRAGATEYEFSAHQPDLAEITPAPSSDDEEYTMDTIGLLSVPLTDDQRLVLVVMAEHALQNPSVHVEVPSNAEMARRLGWTLRRFNRKIDNLCEKFTKAGVPGLHGSVDRLATDRRRRLVEHCIASRTVTRDDLPLLDPYPKDPTAGVRVD